ncbi:hypothetical protein PIB30_076715 [Stylosanthes scabra]|uniref:Uncharacterized protein n=1 Tax=Stylosanthes scabra TaxID=79078 RepID=A0ABU6SRK9_9FABA|nr:hypothetical protein [Stylosanthes scabra]
MTKLKASQLTIANYIENELCCTAETRNRTPTEVAGSQNAHAESKGDRAHVHHGISCNRRQTEELKLTLEYSGDKRGRSGARGPPVMATRQSTAVRKEGGCEIFGG